jgi:hypothetical protein
VAASPGPLKRFIGHPLRFPERCLRHWQLGSKGFTHCRECFLHQTRLEAPSGGTRHPWHLGKWIAHIPQTSAMTLVVVALAEGESGARIV